jgi:hypothetical protein
MRGKRIRMKGGTRNSIHSNSKRKNTIAMMKIKTTESKKTVITIIIIITATLVISISIS